MKVFILAGEKSGVLYADMLAEELRRRTPDVQIRGYSDYGFSIDDLAVFGVWVVLKRIFFFLRVKRTLERAIVEEKPDVVVTIDYPGMNLKLAGFAKAHGIRTVHVVCPQVWAWHQSRIPKIERTVDKLCCFLPFEPAIFRPGFAAFVGHPLAEHYAKLKESGSPAAAGGKLLAVLPGSRLGEIDHHMPTLAKAIVELRKDVPDLRVVIPTVSERAREALQRYVADIPGVEITIGSAREVLGRATCAVASSGTATLEAALMRCPTVVIYKVSPLLGAFLRRAINGVKHVGLANVIWEKSVGGDEAAYPMPEFLQEKFTPENIVQWLKRWFLDDKARLLSVSRLSAAIDLLSSDGNAMARIADFCYN